MALSLHRHPGGNIVEVLSATFLVVNLGCHLAANLADLLLLQELIPQHVVPLQLFRELCTHSTDGSTLQSRLSLKGSALHFNELGAFNSAVRHNPSVALHQCVSHQTALDLSLG